MFPKDIPIKSISYESFALPFKGTEFVKFGYRVSIAYFIDMSMPVLIMNRFSGCVVNARYERGMC